VREGDSEPENDARNGAEQRLPGEHHPADAAEYAHVAAPQQPGERAVQRERAPRQAGGAGGQISGETATGQEPDRYDGRRPVLAQRILHLGVRRGHRAPGPLADGAAGPPADRIRHRVSRHRSGRHGQQQQRQAPRLRDGDRAGRHDNGFGRHDRQEPVHRHDERHDEIQPSRGRHQMIQHALLPADRRWLQALPIRRT
jgi:hypothetical protein